MSEANDVKLKPFPTGLQFIWGGPWHFGFDRLRISETDLALVYEWIRYIGPLEIRKWAKRKGNA